MLSVNFHPLGSLSSLVSHTVFLESPIAACAALSADHFNVVCFKQTRFSTLEAATAVLPEVIAA